MTREMTEEEKVHELVFVKLKKEKGLTKGDAYFLYYAPIDIAMRYFSVNHGIYSASIPAFCRDCTHICGPDDECPFGHGRGKTFT